MNPVKCNKCKKFDKNEIRITNGKKLKHIGTDKIMKCPDCSNTNGYATMCRDCCPTGHGTKFEEW